MTKKAKEMTVLVTGGAGFIGSNFCNFNKKVFKRIIALDNLSLGDLRNLDSSPHIGFVHGDAERRTDLDTVTDRFGPADCVVHLAGATSEFQFNKNTLCHNYTNSVKAFTTVLDWACKNDHTNRFVYASTAALYGNIDPTAGKRTPVKPFSHYTVIQHFYEDCAEFFHRDYPKMEIIGLRFMSVYGEKEEAKAEYANLVSQFCWDIGRGRQPVIYGDGQQTRDFINVCDAVDAITRAVTAPIDNEHCHTCDIGTGESTTLLKVVDCINAAFRTVNATKVNATKPYVFPEVNVRPPNPLTYRRNQQSDVEEARNIIGFRHRVSIEDGIRQLVDQFSDRTPLIRRSSSDIHWSEDSKNEGRLPNPYSPGLFDKREYTEQDWFDTRWASHPDVIDKVATGNYAALTPKVSEFIPTLNCPFHCPHCHFKKQKVNCNVWNNPSSARDVEMEFDQARRYADKLIEGNCFGIHFTGGGEPTIHPRLADIAQHCYELGGELSISTNGTFKAQVQPEQLVELNFQKVRISLDTIEKHREFHGYSEEEDLLDDVLRNIERLIRAKKAASADTQIVICIVFNEDNYKEIPSLGKVICEFGGVNQVIIRPVQDYFGEMKIQVPPNVLEEADTLIDQLRERLNSDGIELIFPGYRHMVRGESQVREFSECRAYGLIGGLWPDGTMYMCTETNGVKGFGIGSLYSQSLEKVYKSTGCCYVRTQLATERFRKCPVTCRPLTLNRLFERIEKRKAEDKESVLKWLNELLALYHRPNPWIQI